MRKFKKNIPINIIKLDEFSENMISDRNEKDFDNKHYLYKEDNKFSFEFSLNKNKKWDFLIKYKSIVSINEKIAYELSNTIIEKDIEILKNKFLNSSYKSIMKRVIEKRKFFK